MKRILVALIALLINSSLYAQDNSKEVVREFKEKQQQVKEHPIPEDPSRDLGDYYEILSKLKLNSSTNAKSGKKKNSGTQTPTIDGVRIESGKSISSRTSNNRNVGGAPRVRVNYDRINTNRERAEEARERARERDREDRERALEKATENQVILDAITAAGIGKIAANQTGFKSSSLHEKLASAGYSPGTIVYEGSEVVDSLPNIGIFDGLVAKKKEPQRRRSIEELIVLLETNEAELTSEECDRIVTYYNEIAKRQEEIVNSLKGEFDLEE